MRRRNSLRLGDHDYADPGAYFITTCILGRACILAAIVHEISRPNRLGDAVTECWRDLPQHAPGIEVDAFVVMPNHVHGILLVGAGHGPPGYGPPRPLSHAVGLFKSASARAINLARATPGMQVWQRGYHDRIVRNEEELHALRRYIAENPLRWGLDRENPSARSGR